MWVKSSVVLMEVLGKERRGRRKRVLSDQERLVGKRTAKGELTGGAHIIQTINPT